MGFEDIVFSISAFSIFAFDNPIKISEPTTASPNDSISFLEDINSFFSNVKLFLFSFIGPLLSNIIILSDFTPNALYIFPHEIAAAPAPQITILTSSIFFSAISSALIKAAPEIIAVPC